MTPIEVGRGVQAWRFLTIKLSSFDIMASCGWPGRLPDATVAQLKETILKDVENVVEPVVRDKNGDVIRLSQVLDRDPIFKEIATGSLVLDSLESLLGPNIELITNRHNHATLNPPSRGYTGLHRDVLQWSRDIVTVIFYLEEATVGKRLYARRSRYPPLQLDSESRHEDERRERHHR